MGSPFLVCRTGIGPFQIPVPMTPRGSDLARPQPEGRARSDPRRRIFLLVFRVSFFRPGVLSWASFCVYVGKLNAPIPSHGGWRRLRRVVEIVETGSVPPRAGGVP